MRIKELAKEIRKKTINDISGNFRHFNEGKVRTLLDLIDGAEDRTLVIHGGSGPKGTYLFFPHPQPTLAEAARRVVNAVSFDGKACLGDVQQLKAALERETK